MSRSARYEWARFHALSSLGRRTSPRAGRRTGGSFHRRLRFEPLEDRRLLSVTLGFTGPYAVSNWTSTGIAGGTTSLLPASGDSDTGTFGYDVTLPFGTGVSPRTADFTLASSPVTGLVTFDYTYTGNHRFFEATAGFSTLVNGGAAPLVNNLTTSGDFNFTGSATLLARSGQSFGFRIGGEHLDFDSHIDGTLSITNIKFFDSIVVDAVGDVSDGNFGLGQLTLREAVGLANLIPGVDKITFADNMSGQTILLGGTELGITESLTIDATELAAPVTIDAQQQSRVINFTATTGDLTLAGLTMLNGRTTAFREHGGGISFASSGVLTLNRSTLSGNSTTGSQADGGGIYTDFGDVTLNQSTLTGNSSIDGRGGGIATFGGDVTITLSTLSENSTINDFKGGGAIYNQNGNVTLNQSTVSGNRTLGDEARGGAIYVLNGSVTLNHSTLSGNSTTGANANGGGIFSEASFGDVTIHNSIFAGNTFAASSTGPDLVAKPGNDVIVNFSLIGTGITPTAGGNNISTDDPKLGPLADNGGPTQTHALLPGSPAIDGGDPNGAASNAVHVYELNGSLADELGGPALVIGVGTLTSEGYEFPAGSGANLNNAVADDEYSIELVFSFDALGGYQKIIDFHDLADDAGLYSSGNNLEFFPAAVAENVLTAGTPTHLVVTRDTATDVVAIYLNGEQVMQFVDSGDIAVFNGLANVIRLFSDDNVTGGTEVASGFLDRIRIYDRDLSAAEVAGLVFDQRGVGFPRVLGGRQDIGAVESPYIIVNSAEGADDGLVTNGITTLREAINLANATPDAHETILFSSNISGQTILLAGAELEITDTLTIDATALAAPVTVDGQQMSRVINFGAATSDLTLAGLTIQNGRTIASNSSGSGGGILFNSIGTLTLTDSTLSGNSTTGNFADGGGIYTNSGDVMLNQSTLSGNSTAGNNAHGGGIRTSGGEVTLNQSTLSGNSTAEDNANGGGIFTFLGDVTLNQSTLSGNSTAGAGADGGGIFTFFGDVTIHNSIVAGNTIGVGSTGPDLAADPGNPITVNYSVVGTGITPTAGGNNIVTNTPLLGPLADNGGPTQTHALLLGSPALDAGDSNGSADHVYELNNSVADELGGPPLVVGGGFFFDGSYFFGPNQGANLNSVVAADEYSIELVFSFDELGGYQKIIDFKDLTEDTGLYSSGTGLDFFNAAVAADVLSEGVPVHLVITRDAATDVVVVYVDGIQVINFVDVNGIGEFTGLSNVVRFFQDDNATGGTEAESGFVDRIRIYDRDLSADEVRNIALDQRGAPFVRVFDGDGAGGARIDIGAFESQPIPPAVFGDYNQNGMVDAADYTRWRDTLGQMGLEPYSGADGNGDGMIGPEDYQVWKEHFGQTLPMEIGSGAQGSGAGEGELGAGNMVRTASDVSVLATQPPAILKFGNDTLPAAINVSYHPRQDAATTLLLRRDDALLAWLASRHHQQRQTTAERAQRLDRAEVDSTDGTAVRPLTAVDLAFGTLSPELA